MTEMLHLNMHDDPMTLCGLTDAELNIDIVTAYRAPQYAATPGGLCPDCLRNIAPGTARTIADAANARGEWAALFLIAWQEAHRTSVKA